MIDLEFVVTQSRGFPDPFSGGGVAMTMCRLEGELDQTADPKKGDPALAVLAQGQYTDDIVYLTMDLLDGEEGEIARHLHPTDARISGFGYNYLTKDIWAVHNEQGWTSPTDRFTDHIIIGIDPGLNAESFRNQFATTPAFTDYEGLAVNLFNIAATQGNTIDLRTASGALLGRREYFGPPGLDGDPIPRHITGISAAPWSWIFCDRYAHELVVIDLTGNEIAKAPLPGPGGGNAMSPSDGALALAYDYVNYPYRISVDFAEVAPLGQRPPDWPWSPLAWVEPHRIYFANGSDETIYAGYLTLA